LPEVTPSGSITFDPLIADDMVKAMEMAYDISPEKRKVLIETAYQFGRQFTWRKTAEDMIAIYRSVL
jgi:glycosyltransferase involved in cell wall biosynthesis